MGRPRRAAPGVERCVKTFTEHEVAEWLPMSEALAAVEAGMRSWARQAAFNHNRRRLAVPHGAMLHAMEAAVELQERWYLGFKMYTTSRQGTHFLVALYDGLTGEPLAHFEADLLGQRRTGAASGVATRLLARPDAQTAGLIGAGWQAESQLEALCAVRPVRQVRVYNRTPEKRERFARMMSARLGVSVQAADSAAAAVRDAAIVVTATNAREPVLPETALAPGVHINAIGSNQAQRRELEAITVCRADRIVVDSIPQCLKEAGDLLQALGADAQSDGWGRVEELATALEQQRGRKNDPERTLFKSTGLALWDVACAARVWENAKASGRR